MSWTYRAVYANLTVTFLLDELIFGEVRRRHDAAIHHEGVSIDKIGIVADQEERRPRLIVRGSQSPCEVFESPAAGYVVVESHRRAGAIRHDAIDPDFM